MKKTFILSSLFFLLLLLSSGCSIHKDSPEEIAQKRAEYYDSYSKKCNNDNCCLQTVSAAQVVNADLYENKNSNDWYCPAGYISDKLRCSNNLHWCVQIISSPIVPPVEENQTVPSSTIQPVVPDSTTATTTE